MHNVLVSKILEILKNGGVVSFPTDTVFALACDASSDEAVEKIYKIKNRDYSKPIAIFVKDFETLKSITKPNEFLNNFKSEILSGKLTVILKISENAKLSKFINFKDDTVGIRIPDHELTQKILRGFGKPIAATSVNLTGKKELVDSSEIKSVLKSKINLIVEGKSENNLPSTIIDLTLNKPKIVRMGALSINPDYYK